MMVQAGAAHAAPCDNVTEKYINGLLLAKIYEEAYQPGLRQTDRPGRACPRNGACHVRRPYDIVPYTGRLYSGID
jgi:hypothetical protein